MSKELPGYFKTSKVQGMGTLAGVKSIKWGRLNTRLASSIGSSPSSLLFRYLAQMGQQGGGST